MITVWIDISFKNNNENSEIVRTFRKSVLESRDRVLCGESLFLEQNVKYNT